MRQPIVGVMGPSKSATAEQMQLAYDVGRAAAQEGWIVLTGGSDSGIMRSTNAGAKSANGVTIGISPNDSYDRISPHVDIPILTGLGNARNTINALACDVMIFYWRQHARHGYRDHVSHR